MLKLLVVSCLMSLGLNLFAQSNVTGVLLDEANGEALGFATVSLTREGQEKPAKYVLTNDKGNFTIEDVRRGSYTLKAELMGYKPFSKAVKMEGKAIDLGQIKMQLDAEQLDAATVTDLGNPVIIKKDTVEYNADAFKTTENDVLLDLLKKLPGIEVGDDGTIKANGETVSKITVDGKTFFLNDPQVATANIPAKVIQKLKVIQKKSEQAEFTGIDDGEEETVIDLSVRPGMMKGVIGNVSGGLGTDIPSQPGINRETRYQGNVFIGKFTQGTNISIIAGGNNTNGSGSTDFSGNMMRGMRGGGGGGGGISTSYNIGANAAGNFFDDRMEIGGNYMFNTRETEGLSESSRTTFFTPLSGPAYNSINNSSSSNINKSLGHSIGMRLEHEFTKNTSIVFEPSINFGTGSYIQASNDTTYRDDLNGQDPTLVNEAFTRNTGNNKNVSASGFFLFRQRLGLPGRTLTANVRFNLSNNVIDGIQNNGTKFFNGDPDRVVNQTLDQRQSQSSINGRMTYTEPLGDHFYFEANYSYNWNRSNSVKETYDIATGQLDYDYSNNVINENNRQELGVNALFQNEKMTAQIGFSAMPTKTHNTTTKYDVATQSYSPQEYNDFRWNFSPQASIFADLGELSTIRVFYRGTSGQPSTSQLMPVPDNSNPLRVSFGNPSLTPYFDHSFRGNLRYSNREKFSSFNINFNAGFTQNPITTATWHTEGLAQYSMPFNGPSTGNARINFFFNIPIFTQALTLNNNTSASYSSRASYQGTNVDMSIYETDGYYAFMEDFIEKFNDPNYYAEHIQENITQTVNASESMRLTYRHESFDFTVGGRTSMNKSWYSIASEQDMTTTWNNQVSADFTWNWELTGMSFKADYNFNWYNGYVTPQESQNVLNASISKMLLNNSMTIALIGRDILGQYKNLMVTDSENYHSESTSNTLGRYVIVSLTWRFGQMGGRRGGMGGGARGGGGRMGGGPMGGMGGGRPRM